MQAAEGSTSCEPDRQNPGTGGGTPELLRSDKVDHRRDSGHRGGGCCPNKVQIGGANSFLFCVVTFSHNRNLRGASVSACVCVCACVSCKQWGALIKNTATQHKSSFPLRGLSNIQQLYHQEATIRSQQSTAGNTLCSAEGVSD